MFEIQWPYVTKLKSVVYSLKKEVQQTEKYATLLDKLKDHAIVTLENKKLNFRKNITIPKIYYGDQYEDKRYIPVTIIDKIIYIIDKLYFEQKCCMKRYSGCWKK
ncbi:unnamed protein product [Acanthoscelides obtectus]|uniref:Uncharacterized protein n=1 Tax=Acanthoscelides obtectus TaxID=200917 RepID=A0A9P0M7T1_ACAOB|nr:unnamed protein product [Acanthoscelides obtectus]CAK1681741.1 hypothetical protein AOBTE_LOCUS33255 [Acanthoscelides obtectus]